MLAEIRYGDSAIESLQAGEAKYDWPLIVLSAGEAGESFDASQRAAFTALHAQLADTLSSRGEHRIVDGAEHITIVTHEDAAQIVAEAIREVTETAAGNDIEDGMYLEGG